eukprot:TRINITY_DN97579_c0_g1_i1.p1 TRINITY_DN97579_c0_g1~~TRINITY_DN97579_c0_g1_i1.p1  ORF type:complete len:172 (+),score=13.71 TRINITY_DN97579_c0_g1_i1:13-528(+)
MMMRPLLAVSCLLAVVASLYGVGGRSFGLPGPTMNAVATYANKSQVFVTLADHSVGRGNVGFMAGIEYQLVDGDTKESDWTSATAIRLRALVAASTPGDTVLLTPVIDSKPPLIAEVHATVGLQRPGIWPQVISNVWSSWTTSQLTNDLVGLHVRQGTASESQAAGESTQT